MNVKQLADKIQTDSGFTLKPTTIEFLNVLAHTSATSIEKIDNLIQSYSAQGITIHKHLDFLFEILERQLNLTTDIEQTISDFLSSRALNYTEMIRMGYTQRWPKLARQTSTQGLTYHTSFHALEVALRTNIGAKSLGIFIEKNELHQFLQYLLLTAAKYHDYEQWERGHPVTNDGFHTPEEQTAGILVDWLISDLGLTDSENPTHERISSLLHYFVKLTIGPGTTILFGRDKIVNLSTIFYELETIAHDAGFSEHSSNRSLIRSIQAVTEVLSAMDKASAASLDVAYHQCSDEMTSIGGHFRRFVSHESHLMDFFALMPEEKRYYPNLDLLSNLEAGGIMNVAHTEMEIELHRESEDAMFLREYIQRGQAIYKTNNNEELTTHLHLVLTDERIAKSFQHIYLEEISAEQQFACRLPDICQQINLKLHRLGYLNQHFESCYLIERENQKNEHESVQGLRMFSSGLTRSISNSFPSLAHPFLDPHVFEKEVHILGALKDHIEHLEEKKKREIIQEILIVSICQPGIRYSNHPELIHIAEPTSPINCKTPLVKTTSSSSLGLKRYSSFTPNYSSDAEGQGRSKTEAFSPR